MVTKKAKTTAKRAAKKTAARATKKSVTRKAARSPSTTTDLQQLIEKTRNQLGAALEKSAAQSEKSVERIKVRLDKAVAKQTAQRDRKNAAAEKATANRTPATLRQLARARDALRVAGQKVSELREEMRNAKQQLKDSAAALKKFTAEQKVQEKFEKDWAKAAAPKKRKATRKRRTRKAAAQSGANGS